MRPQAKQRGSSDGMFVVFPLAMAGALFLFSNVSQELGLGIMLLLVASMFTAPIPFFMMAIFAFMPFQQSLVGETAGNLSLSDGIAGLLCLTLPFTFMRRRRLDIGSVGVPLLLFLLVATVSSISYWGGLSTAVSLGRMFMGTLAAVLIFANSDNRLSLVHRCFTFYLMATNVLSVFAVIAFLQGGTQASMYTLGLNKNFIGPVLGCGIIISLLYLMTDSRRGLRRSWLMLTLAMAGIGIVLSLSRGAWIATSVGFLFILLTTRNAKALVISTLVLVPALALIWRNLPEEATTYATDISTKSYQIRTRIDSIGVAMEAFESSPVMGVGVGLRKTVEPHNVVLLTLAETGIAGLIGFLGMCAAGFYTFWIAAKWARGEPQAMQIVLIGSTILLVSIVHGMMDVYWRRGIGFMGWACVGMAVNIIRLGRSGRLHEEPRRKAAA